MASKRKLECITRTLWVHIQKGGTEDAGAGGTVGPLATRTEDPLQPSDSTEEQGEVEAESSEDAAGAEVTLAAAATAASTSDLLPGWTVKLVDEWWMNDLELEKLG